MELLQIRGEIIGTVVAPISSPVYSLGVYSALGLALRLPADIHRLLLSHAI